MSLLKLIFSKQDPIEDLFRWAPGFASEIERVYRNHVSPFPVSGIGLLKVRTIAMSFGYCAYSPTAKSEDQEKTLRISCYQIAGHALVEPTSDPKVALSDIKDICPTILAEAVGFIAEDFSSNAVSSENPSFKSITRMYRDSLANSVDTRTNTADPKVDFELIPEQVLFHCFKCMAERLVYIQKKY